MRDGVTVGVVDTSVRLVQPADRARSPSKSCPRRSSGSSPACRCATRNIAQGLSAQLRPRFVRLSVRGAQRGARASTVRTGVQAFVDLAGLGTGRYNLRVQVDPTERFGVVAIDPAVVAVTIK